MNVFVLSINSESGHEYGPYVFYKKLSDTDLKMFLCDNFPRECFVNNQKCLTGPGDFGTYLYTGWLETEIL